MKTRIVSVLALASLILAFAFLATALAAPNKANLPAAPAANALPATPAAMPADPAEPHRQIREALAALRRAKEHMQHGAHHCGAHRLDSSTAPSQSIRWPE